MRAELKRKDQRYQNRTRWATVFFDHGQSTESLSWSKTDNRILEQAKIFCVVVSQRTRSVIYFMSHVSYSQLWYLSITHHIFCKFPSSVLDFIFTLPVFFEVQFSQFIHSVVSNSLRPREPQHTRTTYASPAARAHPNPCPRSRWCHPTISSSVVPFSCPQSFPPSGSFPWVSSSHQVAKVLEFQLQHQSFQWTTRTDLLWDGLVGSPCRPGDSCYSLIVKPSIPIRGYLRIDLKGQQKCRTSKIIRAILR